MVVSAGQAAWRVRARLTSYVEASRRGQGRCGGGRAGEAGFEARASSGSQGQRWRRLLCICSCFVAASGAGGVGERESRGRGSGPTRGGWGAGAAGDRLCRAPGIVVREEEVQARDQDRPQAAGGFNGVGGRAEEEDFCRGRGGKEGVEGSIQCIRWRLCILPRRHGDDPEQDGRGRHVGRLLRARGTWQVSSSGSGRR